MTNNENTGFSLVELIVVVLIMGTIAVALAPQVMKWVAKARESSDDQKQQRLVSVAQIAVAEYESTGKDIEEESYLINSSGVVVANGAAVDVNTGISQLFEEYLKGDYPRVEAETGKVFQVRFWENGKKISVSKVNGIY